MDQDVEALLILQLVHAGLKADQQVVVKILAYLYLLQAHVPFMGGVDLIAAGVLFPGVIVFAETHGDFGLAIGNAPPVVHHGFHQHFVGGVLLHAELTGLEVDGDALGKAYLCHAAAGVPYELILAHGHLGAAFLYTGHVSVSIHIEDGSVGQQVAVQPAGRIVALDIAVQHVLAGEGIVGTELYVCIGLIHSVGNVAESAGLGNGDGIGPGYHGSLNAVQQVQVHVAAGGDHPLDYHRVDMGLQIVALLVHHVENDRDDIDVEVALGLGVHPAVGAGEGIDIEVIIFIAHVLRALHYQLMGPDGIHAGAGGDIGHFLHRIQTAPLVAGPDEADGAFIVGDEAGDIHVSAAAAEHLYLRHIAGVMDSAAHIVPIHGRIDVALVPGVDRVEGYAPVGAVGDNHPGEHGLVIHRQIYLIVGVDVGPALEVVAYVVEHNVPGAVVGIVVVRLLDAHFPYEQGAVIVGHIYVDACRSIAEIEDRAGVHSGIAGGAYSVVVLGLLDYGAALLQCHGHTPAVKLIVGDAEHRSPEYHIGAYHGAVDRIGASGGLCYSFAQSVELHRGTHIDIGVPVFRERGRIHRSRVMAGDVRIDHVHLGGEV